MVNTNRWTREIIGKSLFFSSGVKPERIRHFSGLIALIVLTTFSGCRRPPSIVAAPSAAPVEVPASTPAANSLDAAAVEAAQAEFDKTWLKRGDWWFSVRGTSSKAPRLVALRAIDAGLRYVSPLSEADRANGIEWQGVVAFEGQTTRQCPLDDSHRSCKGDWQEWQPEPGQGAAYTMTRKNGRWESENLDNYGQPPADADYLKEN